MSSSNEAIFYPLMIQVLLTIALYIALAVAKSRAVRAGLVDHDRRALRDDAWPESVQKINNNIRNQFELPVLFYVLVIALYQTGAAGLPAQALAWLFVISRMVHAGIHTGPNVVALRRPVFMFGCLMVVAMLGVLAVAVLG